MSYGPFADVDEMGRWLEEPSRSEDPLFLTVVVMRPAPSGSSAS